PMPRMSCSLATRAAPAAASWSTRTCCAKPAKPISTSTRSNPGSRCCPTCSCKGHSMKYLHSMVRVRDLDASLRFYCEGLGLREVRRRDVPQGEYTLVFLSAPGSPEAEIELTYNWDSTEDYGSARNFGHLAFRVDD